MTSESHSEAPESVEAAPPVVEAVLGELVTLESESTELNTARLRHRIDQTLWWSADPGTPQEEDQTLRRASARRWALQELRAWNPELPQHDYRLQVILTTLLGTSDTDAQAIESVTSDIPQAALLEVLSKLVGRRQIQIPGLRLGQDAGEATEELIAAGRSEDYRKLGALVHHLRVEIAPDVLLAIKLLRKFAPDHLALQIEKRRDFVSSLAVREALDDAAASFALSVNDVMFKFVCVAKIAGARISGAPSDAVDTVRSLLVQAARGKGWGAWLSDFARYPHTDTVSEKALSEALNELGPVFWAAFIDAVELWTYPGTAGPVANILFPLVGVENACVMWQLAFDRWNRWDYGREENDKYLPAPATCSFDFPVAMHYAVIPAEEAEAEHARLQAAIAGVEQVWFSDFSSLVTQRNRLASRLRLVEHGLRIRKATAEALGNVRPLAIKPDDEFSEIRYRYFDPHQRFARGRTHS